MLVFVGLSHQRAPIAVRERCAVSAEQRERVLADLRAWFGHVVLVSTCGRTELYIDHPEPDVARREALAFLARRASAGPEHLMHYVECAAGELAVLRLVRVACGLESALLGENEILGQVRRAWLDAAAAGASSPRLDAAFRLAVRTGRQARRLGGDHGWTSLAESAADRVARAIEQLPAPRVLIAGSGPMGLHAARALQERFGPRLALELAGRTPARVLEHASRLRAKALTLADLPDALERADAAVFGLRTPHTVIAAGQIAARPPERPLLLVDLSVPRAVDAAAGGVTGVTLHDVDALGTMSHAAGGCGRWDTAGLAQVEQLAADAAKAFSRGVMPAVATLAALRLQADGIRRTQLARTMRRLPQLDGEAIAAIDALTRAIVNRLLHAPTLRLKADHEGELARQVGELFGVLPQDEGNPGGIGATLPAVSGGR